MDSIFLRVPINVQHAANKPIMKSLPSPTGYIDVDHECQKRQSHF